MEYFNQALLFMRAHENLAGWAQAFGALVALFLAIGVPAYQRHTQTLDMRRQRADLNLVLASSGAFLLNDVVCFLNGLVTLSGLPRSVCRDDAEVADFLERIRSLEAREISHARIITLYAARGALLLTNRELCSPDFQKVPLSENELQNVKKRIESVTERLMIAEYDADCSIGRARSLHTYFPARPITSAAFACYFHFKHRHLPFFDRLYGTK